MALERQTQSVLRNRSWPNDLTRVDVTLQGTTIASAECRREETEQHRQLRRLYEDAERLNTKLVTLEAS
jgi:hypothetical protein